MTMSRDEQKTVAVMCFSSGSGGMELDAIKLASRLSGISDVTLLCKSGSFIQQQYEQGSQQGRHHFSCQPIRFSSRVFSLSMLFAVRAFLREKPVDNVIFFGASELKTLYFAFLGSDINLIIRHGTTKSRAKTDWFHRMVYSRVDHHVALSHHLIENVKQIIPSNGRADYRVIYSSFDLHQHQQQKPAEAHEQALKIVHVGRVVSGKGQIDAVMACALLKQNSISFRLDLLGGLEDTQYSGRLQEAIIDHGLEDEVSLHGHVTDVSRYLQEADIFLFPSSGEGMPNAFIEAMFFNDVCIAYDNTVFPEFRRMGFHIHLVDDGDVGALRDTLLEVTSNLGLEKERSGVNTALAERYFRPETELEQWHGVLI